MTAADRKAIVDTLFTIASLTDDILDRLDDIDRAKAARRAKRVVSLPRVPLKDRVAPNNSQDQKS